VPLLLCCTSRQQVQHGRVSKHLARTTMQPAHHAYNLLSITDFSLLYRFLTLCLQSCCAQVKQAQLPYAGFKALEPRIDAKTMELHVSDSSCLMLRHMKEWPIANFYWHCQWVLTCLRWSTALAVAKRWLYHMLHMSGRSTTYQYWQTM
jgi:hypothetical protein